MLAPLAALRAKWMIGGAGEPRVASQTRQPWALFLDPVGVVCMRETKHRREAVSLVSHSLFCQANLLHV